MRNEEDEGKGRKEREREKKEKQTRMPLKHTDLFLPWIHLTTINAFMLFFQQCTKLCGIYCSMVQLD